MIGLTKRRSQSPVFIWNIMFTWPYSRVVRHTDFSREIPWVDLQRDKLICTYNFSHGFCSVLARWLTFLIVNYPSSLVTFFLLVIVLLNNKNFFHNAGSTIWINRHHNALSYILWNDIPFKYIFFFTCPW